MNLTRFLRKCITDQAAAWRSMKLVTRSVYGSMFWRMFPGSAIRYRLPTGAYMMLEPGHSFTACFWPGVDQYEPDVVGALECLLRLGDTFVDCGANVGYFSLLAAGLLGTEGRVLAIEANPHTFRLLERNLRINDLSEGVQCALTSRPGSAELFVPKLGGDVYGVLRRGGIVKESEEHDIYSVRGCTLDEVLKEREIESVDMVKLDIEGAELDVLKSAPHLLGVMRPRIIMEYGVNTWSAFGVTHEDLLALVSEFGYRIGLFHPTNGRIEPPTPSIWKSVYVNLLLVPEEL